MSETVCGAGFRGTVLWMTGLSGAGKTTLACELRSTLQRAGVPCCVLDGDELRCGVNSDLGFSPQDRLENNRRTAEIAALLVHSGIVAIVAVISPYATARLAARELITKANGLFLEVFVNTPLEVCETRDAKGHYQRARCQSKGNFTGVHAPYEVPEQPDVVVHPANEDTSASAAKVVATLVKMDANFSYLANATQTESDRTQKLSNPLPTGNTW